LKKSGIVKSLWCKKSNVFAVPLLLNFNLKAFDLKKSSSSNFYETNAALRIQNNDFSRVWRAVYMHDFSNSAFTGFTANNKISMVFDNQNPFTSQYGIQHVNNLGDVVNTNTITGTAATLLSARTAGVYKSMNSNSSTQCNSVATIYTAFEFASNNAGAFWRTNTMATNRHGLYLSNNGIISQQGSLNSPQDNVWQNPGWWTGTNYATWTQNSGAANSKIFRRTFNPYNPLNNDGFPNVFSYATFGNLLAANNNAPFSPCFPAPPCPNCNPSLVASLSNIVSGSVTYTDNIAEATEINETLVFRDLNDDPTMADSSTVLSNFYTTATATTPGTFNETQSNIKQGNYNLVHAILAAINPNSNIENNNKIYFNLLNNYIQNDSLTPADKLALFILAHQCPFTDGPAVYKARGLLSLVTQNVKAYNDINCTELGFSFRENPDSTGNGFEESETLQLLISNEKISSEKFKKVTGFKIFPNPTSGNVTILSSNPSEKINIQVLDVNGKLILTQNMNIINFGAVFQFDLINGIYFIKITNEKGEHTVKKLVVVKD